MAQYWILKFVATSDPELHMYYGPGISMYCRKIKTLLHVAKVDYKSTFVNVMAGEHKDKYGDQLPTNATPTLREGEFALTGSNAILRYLAGKHAPQMYPADIRERAKVDMALDLLTPLEDCGRDFILAVYVHKKEWPSTKTKEGIEESANTILEKINKLFCNYGEYMTGATLTIADMAFYTVAKQFALTTAAFDYAKFQRIQAWLALMEGNADMAGVEEINKQLTDCCQECLDKMKE
eukprot:736764_1